MQIFQDYHAFCSTHIVFYTNMGFDCGSIYEWCPTMGQLHWYTVSAIRDSQGNNDFSCSANTKCTTNRTWRRQKSNKVHPHSMCDHCPTYHARESIHSNAIMRNYLVNDDSRKSPVVTSWKAGRCYYVDYRDDPWSNHDCWRR